MSIFAMRVERTGNRPHIWPGSEPRSNYSQTTRWTVKEIVSRRLRSFLFYRLDIVLGRRRAVQFRSSIKPDLG
jgi:hypothetical protein